jgi:ubiquinone/menaquinone biosynthesis C-methylase UbiE
MSSSESSSYIIYGGQQGADRLTILANAMWPYTRPFLQECGLRPGMKCLDIGCGNGAMTLKIFSEIGPSGEITGVDFDPSIVQIAKQNAVTHQPKINFAVLDIENHSLESGSYDFIFCRFLLSHLKSPGAALQKINLALRPKGVLAVEDIDTAGHFCHPQSNAFRRYVELYEQTGIKKGVNPLIGPLLPGLLESARFQNVEMKVVLPTFRSGEGKQMALLTMLGIQRSVVSEGLATEEEVREIIHDLSLYTEDEHTIISFPRIFQVSGKIAPSSL